MPRENYACVLCMSTSWMHARSTAFACNETGSGSLLMFDGLCGVRSQRSYSSLLAVSHAGINALAIQCDQQTTNGQHSADFLHTKLLFIFTIILHVTTIISITVHAFNVLCVLYNLASCSSSSLSYLCCNANALLIICTPFSFHHSVNSDYSVRISPTNTCLKIPNACH